MARTAAPESISLWAPPAVFDSFTVLRPLGRGGMGHVYLGRDRQLDRFVALKFIASRNPASIARERFLVEARAIARLSHPNVVSVYTIGEVEGRPYIAYEFVAGHSLDRLALPLGWHMVLRVAVAAARGLEAAHAQGVLHRDLKPGNIMLSDRGDVKLLDFGLAKLEEPTSRASGTVIKTNDDATTQDSTLDGSVESSGAHALPIDVVRVTEPPIVSDRALTRPGVLMGTPAYMAPELWLGEAATQRSDLFALGLVLFELLVGTLPHAGMEAEEISRRLIEQNLPSIREARPDVPESLAAIVDRTLRRDPAERYGSAADLRAALEEISKIFLRANADAEPLDPSRVAVAASYARIRDRGDSFVSRVYERLFAGDPSVRALFPADIAAQKQKLLHMLGLAVGDPAEADRILPVLEDLGRRHLHYGVAPAHFRALEEAVLGALAEHDAPSWDGDLEHAWRLGFRFVESAMTRGMSSERATMATEDSVTIARWPRAPATPVPPQEIRTRYAANGEVSLAYQSFGSGPLEIVALLGWITHVELSWQHKSLANFLRRLGRLGRVVIMDKRGTGLSDRAFEAASLQDRVDDIRAVLADAGVTRPLFVGVSEGASMAALFAALHPNATRGVVLYGGTARMLATDDYPHGLPPEFVSHVSREMRVHWGEPMFVELEAPSMKDDRQFCEWLALFMRMASSPGNAVKMLEHNAAIDLRGVLPHVSSNALVIHRRGDRVAPFGAGAHLAENIPNAQLVALDGDDHLPFVGDVESVHRAIEAFARDLRPETKTAPMRIVLMATTRDGSPTSAIERIVGPVAARHRGERIEVENGVAIAFDGAPRAARAAIAIANSAHNAGLAVGVALDAGVADRQLLDRLHTRAADAELSLPTATALVRDLAAGSNVGFMPIENGLFVIEP